MSAQTVGVAGFQPQQASEWLPLSIVIHCRGPSPPPFIVFHINTTMPEVPATRIATSEPSTSQRLYKTDCSSRCRNPLASLALRPTNHWHIQSTNTSTKTLNAYITTPISRAARASAAAVRVPSIPLPHTHQQKHQHKHQINNENPPFPDPAQPTTSHNPSHPARAQASHW